MPNLAFWLLLHVVGAGILTWTARHYALRRGLVDAPGARRSHLLPTPRGGGVAIVLCVLFGCLWMAWRQPLHTNAILTFSAGVLLVAGIGWFDDHRPLPASFRFAVHLTAACFLAATFLMEGLPWLQVALGWLLAVSLVNIWNFMDGINGLASSQAAIAAGSFALLMPAPWSWIGWSLCAACLGFLPFNFPRAQIFLGDVGSGALGYVLAALVVFSLAHSQSSFLVFLPMVAFCVDAGLTLLQRVLGGEAWWQPHTTHAYQRAAVRVGHSQVTMRFALFSGLLTILMLTNQHAPAALGFLVLSCSVCAAALAWIVVQRRYGIWFHG